MADIEYYERIEKWHPVVRFVIHNDVWWGRGTRLDTCDDGSSSIL
jgi:hypothetical protein